MFGQPIQQWFLAGVGIGFIIGLTIGYYVWSRRHTNTQGEKRLSQLQVAGICLVIFYIGTPIFGLPEPDSMIAIALISIIAGEDLGAAVAKFLERTPYVDKKENNK